MSIKSSFDTVFVEKAHDDPLQFLSDPSHIRKDLKGLSDSARKSFSALKPWQQAAICFYNPATSLNISKIVERVDECHTAIKTTLAVAQIGRPFADDVAALCDTLSRNIESPQHLDELLSKLIATAEKGYGRSIQAHGQLICVRYGLSQISEDIPLQVTRIQEETKDGNVYTDPAFNGLNTCFLTITSPITSPITTNEEETDIWRAPVASPVYLPCNYLTFQNVITQLNTIAADILLFTEQIGRCAEWWSKMKNGMEILRDTLQKVAQSGPQSFKVPDNVTEGWESVADRFALYVYKTSPVVKDYVSTAQIPYIAGNYYAQPYLDSYPTPMPPPRRCRIRSRSSSRSRSYSPRRPYAPSPPSTPSPTVVAVGLPSVSDAVVKQKEKPQPLWKRLSCMA